MPSIDVAKAILDDMIEANKGYWPGCTGEQPAFPPPQALPACGTSSAASATCSSPHRIESGVRAGKALATAFHAARS